MSRVRVIVLRAAGINCDRELCHAFELAGADEVELVHIRALAERTDPLGGCSILALPGGFSYGDDIEAGKVLATHLRRALGAPLRSFVDDGGLAIGICNGFQVLVATGILPGLADDEGRQTAALAPNLAGHFVDRWTPLETASTHCAWAPEAGSRLELPIAHGEGRFETSPERLEALRAAGQVVFRYGKGSNPNGSQDDIAGICDPTGRVLGLMPHPERHVLGLQHPRWQREGLKDEGAGLEIFRRGVAAAVRT